MFMMCFVAVCFQDRVCCGENADQLVYIPPLQVSEGNSLVFCDPSIHSSIHWLNHSFSWGLQGGLEPIAADTG